jgi:hypothetical protein
LRQVSQVARRLTEAARLGFACAVVPASTPEVPGIALVRATDISAALQTLGPPVVPPNDGVVTARRDYVEPEYDAPIWSRTP